MNGRQAFALSNPLDQADLSPATLAPYKLDRKHATGLILRSILAVDR